MKLNPFSWLRGCLVKAELARWADAGIVTPDVRQEIANQYDEHCCGLEPRQFARVSMFAVASAAMVLALILVVCEQWSFISFSVKLGVAGVSAMLAHGAGYWVRFVRGDAARGNWLFFVGTLIFGGGVWIVVGAEHTGTLYPWAFCIWAIGALPLGLVLNSRRLLVLANLLGVAWFAWQMTIAEGAGGVALYFGMVLFTLHWSYANRSRGLLIFTLVATILLWAMIPIAEDLGPQGWFWVGVIGPLLCLIGQRHDESHEFGDVYHKLGRAIVPLVLLALSLPSVTADLMAEHHRLPYWLTVAALLGLVIVLAPGPRRWSLRRDWPPLAVLAAVALVPALLGVASQRLPERIGVAASIALSTVYGAVVVAVSAWLTLNGGKQGCVGRVLFGVVYAAAWVVLLCFDLAGRPSYAAMACAVTAAALLLAARYGPRWMTNHEASAAEDA